jgi:glycosyltransferase involved in cell wall biosynthesis
VIPCLNEEDSLGVCLAQARTGLAELGEPGEIVVADNGSSDDSPSIAAAAGARVVHVKRLGYGSALMGGIAAARGRWIVMGDADASYDFAQTPRFVAGLRGGKELVMGCRLPVGGGRVEPGAMPTLHRWLGNPAFSAIARTWFRTPVHDIHCGMRAFTRELYDRLDLQCTGMEFASEMVIKASLRGARIAEVPITLHLDQRRSHPPHLRTFRDGWRHLRFFLLFSPRWLFGVPGVALILIGIIAGALAFPAVHIGRVGFDVHTLLFAGFFLLLGVQTVLFGVLAKAYAVGQGLQPSSPWLVRSTRWLRLEAGIVTGLTCSAAGLGLLAWAVIQWAQTDFGPLDYSRTMRTAIPGVTLGAIGFQIILASFLLGVFALPHRGAAKITSPGRSGDGAEAPVRAAGEPLQGGAK